jgi:hypothetical protein
LDLVASGNTDGKHPCLDNGQTVMNHWWWGHPPKLEFVEFWSETFFRNGRPPTLVDDPLFLMALVTTSHMGQTTVFMGKRTGLGKRDTTLLHHDTFTRKIIGTWIRVSRRISDQWWRILLRLRGATIWARWSHSIRCWWMLWVPIRWQCNL